MWSFENQLEQMLACQAALNEQTSTQNWALRPGQKPKASDYLHQVMRELGELTEHIDPLGKWWSKKPFDPESVCFACKLELVDIVHFYMSIWLCRREEGRSDIGIEPVLEAGFITEFSRAYGAFTSVEPAFDADWFERLKRACRRFEKTNSPEAFVGLLVLFNVSPEELVRLYAGKNALNRLRQANGYGEGTYIKDWFEGREDTWVLLEIAEHAASSMEELISLIQAELQTKYDNWKAVV